MEEFNFDDLAPIQISVSIGKVKYFLVEASEDAAVKYRNSIIREARMGPDGKTSGVGNVADAEPLLVSLCLYRADAQGGFPLDAQGRPDARHQVNLQVVRSWPARIVKPLFDKVKEISQLDEKETKDTLQKRLIETQEKLDGLENGHAEEHLKNSSDATAATSA